MAQVSGLDLNKIDGWLDFSGNCSAPPQNAVFIVSKTAEFLNGEGKWEERDDVDLTTEEETGPVCISQGNESAINIVGVVKFKDGTAYNEPEGGWNVSNFIAMIEQYELQRRMRPENYFLGGFDYQHVLWAGMDKEDDFFVIHWDS
mgnify:CR=1 FL=1